MSDFYSELQDVAGEVLGEFKQGVVTLTREVDTLVPIDAEASWLGTVKTTASYTLDAVVAAVTVDQANAKYIDGTTITIADLVVTCAVPAVTPQMSDTLSIDGKKRTMKKIVQVPPAGVPVAFKLFIQG